MAKIFDVNSDVHESPNRNTFDLQHKRHMTGKAGVIYPFFCQPVVPTDSFEIDTAIGANLMPMWYPTQSNMRFIVHYFYVPYRIMHDGWKNQLEGLETEAFPYIEQAATFYKTGSLADYLGIPTNVVLSERQLLMFPTHKLNGDYVFIGQPSVLGVKIPTTQIDIGVDDYELVGNSVTLASYVPITSKDLSSGNIFFPFAFREGDYLVDGDIRIYEGKDVYDKDRINFNISRIDANYSGFAFLNGPVYYQTLDRGTYYDSSSVTTTSLGVDTASFNAAVSKCEVPILILNLRFYDTDGNALDNLTPSDFVTPALTGFKSVYYTAPAGLSVDLSVFPQYSPYYNASNVNDTVKISAYPFRAYEMIYNSFYRNSQGVQPLVDGDNHVLYNKYLVNTGDGADTFGYALHSRNWELDAYTSCLPSPQQGEAPIIAVDSLGRMRIEDEDGTTSTLELRDLDGEQGVEVRNADIANPEHARLAMRIATSGLTIADFRQGNALQRFLEQSLRSGYRYADFIFGHFGKSPSHQELDMPQFLGGYTQLIDVSKISNVSASGDVPLGEFAGVGASFGGAKHKIKHYFDDYGLVVGVMMLVPDAAYSQVLPKHFTYQSRLDFYFPEFAQLGMQPITYEEMCPIQSHFMYVAGDTNKKLTDTFGYQRPNHEYVWYPDSLHGLFRTSLNGSVINRRFGSRPELGDDFLKIKPEEVNDIFSVIEQQDDIFIAQVVVDIKATRPIPRVVVPSLGR